LPRFYQHRQHQSLNQRRLTKKGKLGAHLREIWGLKCNTNQSNLAKGGIALARLTKSSSLYSPGGSSNLQLRVLAGGVIPESPLTLG